MTCHRFPIQLLHVLFWGEITTSPSYHCYNSYSSLDGPSKNYNYSENRPINWDNRLSASGKKKCINPHGVENKTIIIFKASALWADAFYKSKYPSVCLSVCLSVCVFTFEVPLKRLFAPTSLSRMSHIFRDSESLGKSNGKKWSQIWTFLFKNCLKSPRKTSFFCWLCFTKHGGNHASRWIRDLWSKGVSLILAYL